MTDPKVSPVSALVQRLTGLAKKWGADYGWDNSSRSAYVQAAEELEAALRGGGSSPTGETPAKCGKYFQCDAAIVTRCGFKPNHKGRCGAMSQQILSDLRDVAAGRKIAIPISGGTPPTPPPALADLVTCSLAYPDYVCHPRRLDCEHEAPHLMAACGAFTSAPSSQATPPPPQHVCGLSGYNGMIDPPCPACEARERDSSASQGGRWLGCPHCGHSWETPTLGIADWTACPKCHGSFSFSGPRLVAAPSSSPAPSGRRHEDDEEKDDTRSPSPDVIPATGSPRSTQSGISHGWQPIETAPKDGTDVIVGGAEGVEVAQWQNEHLEQRESGVIVDAGYDAGFWGFSYYGGGPQPTHWMPLPPSPSSQE